MVFAWMLAWAGGTIGVMKHREVNRHPGPMRVVKVDAEFAGFMVAIGFVVLGLVGLPIGKWFLLAALALGLLVACCLRFIRKE